MRLSVESAICFWKRAVNRETTMLIILANNMTPTPDKKEMPTRVAMKAIPKPIT